MSKEADPELQLKPKERAELVDRVQKDWKEREFVETVHTLSKASWSSKFSKKATGPRRE